MNTAAWEEAVHSERCICQLSIIKELEDDLRTQQIFFNIPFSNTVIHVPRCLMAQATTLLLLAAVVGFVQGPAQK